MLRGISKYFLIVIVLLGNSKMFHNNYYIESAVCYYCMTVHEMHDRVHPNSDE